MPTNLPERRASPRNETIPVTFLLGTLMVALMAITLSVALLPPEADATAHDVQLQVAIGIPP